MSIEEMIAILERSKHDHYTERSGIMSCLKGKFLACDCGADAINAEIDLVIAELRGLSSQLFQRNQSWNAE